MHNTFQEKIDIYQCPEKREFSLDDATQITIGDLHANTMTLICLLARHGIIENLTEDNYETLTNFYRKSINKLKQEDIIVDLNLNDR